MIPINNIKIIKKENSYIVNDYVDYLTIDTIDTNILYNISCITTYNDKGKLLDQIDGTFIDIWLNMNGKQQFIDLLTEPPFIIVPLYFLSTYYQIKFEFVDNSSNCEYHFYKDQNSNKIKQSDQIMIESYRKTFRIIYNGIPSSNNLNINLPFNIYPVELIWKYHDDTLIPESIKISSDEIHNNINTNTINTKYFTAIQPLLYHNLKLVHPNIAFYSFGLNPNSYKPVIENTTQYPINDICINNYYSQNTDKYGAITIYLVGNIEK